MPGTAVWRTQRLSELGIDYPGSPIVEGPGKRYFDDSLRGGKGIANRFLARLQFVGPRKFEARREKHKCK